VDRVQGGQLLGQINRTDLADAIRRGANPMHHWFDWDHGGLPYFRNTMAGKRPNAGKPTDNTPGNGHHPSYSLSHVAGRWLDALLNAEAVAGIKIDPKVEANLRQWLLRSMSHKIGLPACLDLTSYEIIPVSDLHNLREVMHGLAALCGFRKDKECEAVGERLIAVIGEYLDYESGAWDEERFNRERGGWTFYSSPEAVQAAGWDRSRHVPGHVFPQTFGRYLGALMRFYAATGSHAALTQAVGLRNHMMNVTFADPSRYDPVLLGDHTHSVTSAISGLARFAAVTGDQAVFDRIEELFDGLLTDIATDFGWCTENFQRDDDYGEINNTADMVESLLLLGQAGRIGSYQRAEGMVRSHILPSQLRDTRFIGADIEPHLAEWSEGAFGFPCPYGLVQEAGGWISYNWDIVGGGVSGLCDVVRHAVTGNANGGLISINMPFDGKYGPLDIVSPYAPGSRSLRLAVDAPCAVRIRLPDWVTTWTATVCKGSDAIKSTRSGDWLFVTGLQRGDEVEVAFDLAVSARVYALKTGEMTATWTGEEITAMDMAFDPPLRFIPPSRPGGATT